MERKKKERDPGGAWVRPWSFLVNLRPLTACVRAVRLNMGREEVRGEGGPRSGGVLHQQIEEERCAGAWQSNDEDGPLDALGAQSARRQGVPSMDGGFK